MQKSASHYTEAAYDEIEILRQVQEGGGEGSRAVVKLLDSFEHAGPNGRHVCMVFEKLGDNLLTLIKRFNYRGVPLRYVKDLTRQARPGSGSTGWGLGRPRLVVGSGSPLAQPPFPAQMLEGLDFLHREKNIIHTDLKPENVLLSQPLPPARGEASVRGGSAAQGGAGSSGAADGGASTSAAAAGVAAASSDGADGTTREVDHAARLVAGSGAAVALSKSQKKKAKKKAKRAAAAATGGVGSAGGAPSASDSGAPEEAADSDAEEGAASPQGDAPARGAAAGADSESGDSDANAAGDSGLPLELPSPLSCKVVDLGNACWTFKQFTSDIQTRQYRCPEVLLGAKYGTPADIWSLACVVFELATGDLLFDPRSGENYDRDEDHLALMMELMGRMPKRIALGGKYSRDFFNRQGELRHIRKLRMWPLDRVLVEKYDFAPVEARAMGAFLEPLLDFVPENRVTAAKALQHPWLAEGGSTVPAEGGSGRAAEEADREGPPKVENGGGQEGGGGDEQHTA